MRTSNMKSLKRCFGTKEFRYNNPKCKVCQFQISCFKMRKKRYPNVKPVERVSNIVKSKGLSNVVTKK